MKRIGCLCVAEILIKKTSIDEWPVRVSFALLKSIEDMKASNDQLSLKSTLKRSSMHYYYSQHVY